MEWNLFELMIFDGADEVTNLVAHCFSCNAGGGCFEIDMARASNTRRVRIVSKIERISHAGKTEGYER